MEYLSEWIILLLAIGIVLFIASVLLRRKRKLRLALRSLGILIGIIPFLLLQVYKLTNYIKERPYVGTYQCSDSTVGNIELQLFDNNTFEMKAESCSRGFVQGRWTYQWQPEDAYLELSSTSQTMGKAIPGEELGLKLYNIPVCLNLIRKLDFSRIADTTQKPREEFTY